MISGLAKLLARSQPRGLSCRRAENNLNIEITIFFKYLFSGHHASSVFSKSEGLWNVPWQGVI